MQTTDEYKAAVSNAIAFKHENPDEKATTAARIHYVNAITVQSNLRREEIYGGGEVKHGGHNKMLSDAQCYGPVRGPYLNPRTNLALDTLWRCLQTGSVS
jgi:hypothetical protein